LIGVVWLIHWNARRSQNQTLNQTLRNFCLPLEVLTAVLLALTGHLGGFLSGVNVPG